MPTVPHGLRPVLLALLVFVASAITAIAGPAASAHTGLACNNGGYYVLWARGSGESFSAERGKAFKHALISKAALGISAWAELGDLDDNQRVTDGEYPAIPVNDYHLGFLPWNYGPSVETGMRELVAHLNDRYAGDGPSGSGPCNRETLVLGGYSQGADVVGWALRRHDLSQTAKDHIGFAALYGDPKFNPGAATDRKKAVNFRSNWWWVRGDDPGIRSKYISHAIVDVPADGVLGARDPYVPAELKGRFASWCASGDIVCAGGGWNAHNNAYQSRWIPESVAEIAYEATRKRNQLNPDNPVHVASYTVTMPVGAAPSVYADSPEPPPPPVIHSVTRTYGPDGSRQVYAATKSAVTEAYWIPGGDGVRKKELIHIAQDNITGMDKTNLPEGKQAVYTAVPDGIWETWWDSDHNPTSAKIITGLSGVRQIITHNRWESAGYTHRLYILAGNGPHEYWWRDGDGEGIRHRLLDSIASPVTMAKAIGPDGEDQLYVATPTWVYELWWWPGESVHHDTLLNITQGDIRSLDKGNNLPDGGQLLYTGTSTTAWQSYWHNTVPSHGTIATAQYNALQIKKTIYNGVHQLYIATPDHVQEYYWGPKNGGGEIFRRPQNDITSFDKSNDGADQQVYTAAGDGVWETYWRGGDEPVGPVSKLLFRVTR